MNNENFISDNGFVLHRYAYRETSFIIDIFTQHHGRISVIAKGVRNPKSPLKGLLQPFMPLHINAKGKSQLKTLTLCELYNSPIQLTDTDLISGLYLNELLMRLLHKEEISQHLFLIYHSTLLALEGKHNVEKALRIFEKNLLETLGYALPLLHEAETHREVEANSYYKFIPEHGLDLYITPEAASQSQTRDPGVFLGDDLINIHHDKFDAPEVLLAAKKLMRLALMPLLGNKPLKSRELFKSMKV